MLERRTGRFESCHWQDFSRGCVKMRIRPPLLRDVKDMRFKRTGISVRTPVVGALNECVINVSRTHGVTVLHRKDRHGSGSVGVVGDHRRREVGSPP